MLPAEARQPASEGARDSRRQECLNIVQPTRGGAVARGVMQRQKSLPAMARRAGGGIVQQVRFGRQAQQDGHYHASGWLETRSSIRGGILMSGITQQGIATRYFPAPGGFAFASVVR